MEIIRKRSRDELVEMVRVIFAPPQDMPEAQIDRHLYEFCVNCPDPVAAMDLVIQAAPGSNPESLVHKALLLPFRPVSNVGAIGLSADHPIRQMRLQTLELVGGSKHK